MQFCMCAQMIEVYHLDYIGKPVRVQDNLATMNLFR